MLIEATDRPFTYTWPHGEIQFEPGTPVDVSAERGIKILKRCGARVKAVTPFVIGDWVEFHSPLFGVCTGRVLSLEVEAIRITEHSVVKEPVTIPVEWVTRTIEDPQGSITEGK